MGTRFTTNQARHILIGMMFYKVGLDRVQGRDKLYTQREPNRVQTKTWTIHPCLTFSLNYAVTAAGMTIKFQKFGGGG